VRAQGIELCQGYLFARPLPVAAFEALLASPVSLLRPRAETPPAAPPCPPAADPDAAR
jgi:hypothetical protein